MRHFPLVFDVRSATFSIDRLS